MATLDLLGQFRETAGGSWNEIENDAEKDAGDTRGDSRKPKFDADEDPESYMSQYEQLKSDITTVERNAQNIQGLTNSYAANTDPSQFKDIMNELDSIIAANKTVSNKIKQSLQNEKTKNDAYSAKHKGSSTAQWRVNQLNSCTKRFKESSSEFSSKLNDFNKMLQQTQNRQLDIVSDKKLSPQDKEELLENPGQAQRYLQQQLNLEISDAMMDRIVELEERYEGMLRIEQSIRELQELWQELYIMITEQQELLDNISYNVTQTKDYVQSGVKHLEKAEEHQKTSRKLQLCLGVCLIIIAVILLAVFHKSL